MTKTMTTLLAGTALLFAAGSAAAFATSPEDAAKQAADDAHAAAAMARDTARDGRDAARAGREAAREGREAAREARDAALEAAREARREVRIYRGGPDAGVYVFRGGDRAEHLRTILQLRSNQEAALTAYLAAVGDKRASSREWRFDKDDAATTPERLAKMEQRLAEQQAAMRGRIEATKAFYGQLDEKQRKVFDALPMLMFAGPGFGPMLMPIMNPPVPPVPPIPPKPPAPPRGL